MLFTRRIHKLKAGHKHRLESRCLRLLYCCLSLVPGLTLGDDDPGGASGAGGPPAGLFGGNLTMGFDRAGPSRFRGIGDERQSAHVFEIRTDYRFPVSRNAVAGTGLAYRRYAFSPTGLPLPETLREISLPVTLTLLGEDGPRYILTVTPGVGFEDSVTTRAARVSFLGVRSFSVTDTLSLQLAAFGGTASKYPVLPGAGLVWRFSESGTLRLLPPRPEIEFTPSPRWTFAVGGSYHSSSFRVAEKEGIRKNALLNLTEFRSGVRVVHQIGDTLELTAGAGWLLKRKFDHHRENVVHRTRGAPYGQVGLRASF